MVRKFDTNIDSMLAVIALCNSPYTLGHNYITMAVNTEEYTQQDNQNADGKRKKNQHIFSVQFNHKPVQLQYKENGELVTIKDDQYKNFLFETLVSVDLGIQKDVLTSFLTMLTRKDFESYKDMSEFVYSQILLKGDLQKVKNNVKAFNLQNYKNNDHEAEDVIEKILKDIKRVTEIEKNGEKYTDKDVEIG